MAEALGAGAYAVALACICTFCMGGVIFGASSLLPSLYAAGYWRSLCGEDGVAICEGSREQCCEDQLLRYSLVLSTCFFVVDAASAPWGELADRQGGRVCLIVATLISITGFMLLSGGAARSDSDLLTTCALLLIALAGPGIFNAGYVSCHGVIGDNATLKGVHSAFMAAVFDGSALVFFLLQLAEVSLGGLSVPALFWSLICACLGGGFWYYLRPGSPASTTCGLDGAEEKHGAETDVSEQSVHDGHSFVAKDSQLGEEVVKKPTQRRYRDSTPF